VVERWRCLLHKQTIQRISFFTVYAGSCSVRDYCVVGVNKPAKSPSHYRTTQKQRDEKNFGVTIPVRSDRQILAKTQIWYLHLRPISTSYGRGSQIISILNIDLPEADIYRFPAENPIFRSISFYMIYRRSPKTPVKYATRAKRAAKFSISISFLDDISIYIAISFFTIFFDIKSISQNDLDPDIYRYRKTFGNL
jgi:hypothetical protein